MTFVVLYSGNVYAVVTDAPQYTPSIKILNRLGISPEHHSKYKVENCLNVQSYPNAPAPTKPWTTQEILEREG